MSKLILQDLIATLQGNLDAFSRLQSQPHEALLEASHALGTLIVRPGAVKRVLIALRDGQASPILVHKWGFFVRHGFIGDWIGEAEDAKLSAQDRKLHQRFDIEYEPEFEDAINAITVRLDEIGDIIDGDVTNEEIERMLPTLDEPGTD